MTLDIANMPIDKLAVQNSITELLTRFAFQCGAKLTPFSFFRSELQKKEEVVSIIKLKGIGNPDDSFIKTITDFWAGHLGIDSFQMKRLFIDYMLNLSAVYCEIPKVVWRDGGSSASYDKFIATRNTKIIARWIGCEEDYAESKYGVKFKQFEPVCQSEDKIYLIKLTEKTDGNSVSVPRTVLSYDKMNILPLFMVEAFINGMRDSLNTKMLKFTYEKDNGTTRDIVCTLSREIYDKYYQNFQSFGDSVFNCIDIDNLSIDNIKLPKSILRGYLRVPEVGASIYDETGCRAINLLRLTKIEETTSPDITYITVNLDKVPENFMNAVNTMALRTPAVLPSLYHELMIAMNSDSPAINSLSTVEMLESLNTFVDTNVMMLSTSFKRFLHQFALDHSNQIPEYVMGSDAKSSLVGSTSSSVSSSTVVISDDF